MKDNGTMNTSEGVPAPIVCCQQLSKSFRLPEGELHLLNRVDFELHAGETVSLVGESGSGKSTFLNVLAGLEPADEGKIFWRKRSVGIKAAAGLAPLRGRSLGFVFQAYHLIPEMNLLDNVLMARRLVGKVRKQDRERGKELLDRVGLGDRLNSPPQQLSGGEKQRVAVARALINAPGVILADEPTGNLDEKTSEGVMELLFNLVHEEGAGLLLVTHNTSYARKTQKGWRLHLGQLEPLT